MPFEQAAGQPSPQSVTQNNNSFVPEAPSIDDVVKNAWAIEPNESGNFDAPEVTEKKPDEPLKKSLAEQALEAERERYRQRKMIKENESKYQKEIELLKQELMNVKKGIGEKPPEEAKKKNETFEEMIERLSKNAPEDEDEAPKSKKTLTMEEVQELLDAKLKERDELTNKERAKQEIETGVSKYTNQIQEFAKKESEKYPMFEGFPEASEYAFDLIRQDWNKKSERYGDEYADKHMLGIETACELVNKELETQLESMLQSKSMVKRLSAMISKLGASGNSKPVQTLSSDLENPSGSLNLSEEERIARAIAAMSGSFSED